MITIEPVSFTVDVVGEATGTEYKGVFKVKPLLNQQEQLARDELARTMLGVKAPEASPSASSRAYVLAEIRMRTIDAPAFWKECKYGDTLYDENVMTRIYDQIQVEETKWRLDVKKKADEARGDLAKMPALNAPKAA